MAQKAAPISLGSPRFTSVELPGIEITDIWFPPNSVIPHHTHARPVFAVALDGAIDSRIVGRRLECGRDSVWTEPAGEGHRNRVGPDGARVMVLLPDQSADPQARACGPLLDEVHQFRHGGVRDLAERMALELREPDDAGRLALHGLALEGLALGLREAGSAARAGSLAPWLRAARDLLHDRFRDRMTIHEIAETVGVGASTLARSFRAEFGVPLGTYQRTLRLQWAALQLVETDVALSTVALRAGFYDQAHMSRHFRRTWGLPPGAYRQAHRRT